MKNTSKARPLACAMAAAIGLSSGAAVAQVTPAPPDGVQSVSWVDGSQFSRTKADGPTFGGNNDDPALWDRQGNAYYANDSGGRQFYVAPITAPVGVAVQQVQCYYETANDVPKQQAKFAWNEHTGGLDPESPRIATVVPEVLVPTVTAGATSYDSIVLAPASPVTMTHYLDGDAAQFVKHVVRASFNNKTAVAGCAVQWERQISPAPATASFGDVDPGSIYFPAIEALAASGVTAGCGNGNFCPDDTVTRKQMAVFLAKALGLYHPN